MNGLIPIDIMINELKDDLGVDRLIDYKRFVRWIYTAVSEIDFYVTLIGETDPIKLDETLTIKLPDDAMAIASVLLYPGCIHPIYDSTMKCCWAKSNKCCADFKVSQQENCLHFSSNVLEAGKSVMIKYFRAPLDKEGNPLVPSKYYEAISAFCRWKHLQRIRTLFQGATASRSNPVSASELRIAHDHWKRQHDKAQANIVTPRNFQKLLQAAERALYSDNRYPPPLGQCFQTYYRQRANNA